ncbi:unnamed protein product, partial [Iphiclides podalirius]
MDHMFETNREYSPPDVKMSLEQQMPVLMKETQMSGDRSGTGSQCGLTSLLPMSCRGRAAAFARDLHSRLRNLGATQDSECENNWLTRDPAATHRPTPSAPRELDTFYDFELECESPSSPVDEYEAPFPERSSKVNSEPPFYDVDSDTNIKDQNVDSFEEDASVDAVDINVAAENNIDCNATEIITSEIPAEKDVSPAPDIDPKFLSTESKEDEEAEDDRPQRVVSLSDGGGEEERARVRRVRNSKHAQKIGVSDDIRQTYIVPISTTIDFSEKQ